MAATIHDLSTDLLELLCTHLTVADVANVACVNALFTEICARPSLVKAVGRTAALPASISVRWLERLAGEVGVFKVGLELFTAAGPRAVEAVHEAGAACFLDLKLHDIPATMAKATRAAVQLGVRPLPGGDASIQNPCRVHYPRIHDLQ